MNGIYNAAYVFGFSIGAPLFISLVHKVGIRGATLIGAGSMVALVPVLLLAYRTKPSPVSAPHAHNSAL